MSFDCDSSFFAYYQWCLEQEARWQEEQYELEQQSQLEDSSDD